MINYTFLILVFSNGLYTFQFQFFTKTIFSEHKLNIKNNQSRINFKTYST